MRALWTDRDKVIYFCLFRVCETERKVLPKPSESFIINRDHRDSAASIVMC